MAAGRTGHDSPGSSGCLPECRRCRQRARFRHVRHCGACPSRQCCRGVDPRTHTPRAACADAPLHGGAHSARDRSGARDRGHRGRAHARKYFGAGPSTRCASLPAASDATRVIARGRSSGIRHAVMSSAAARDPLRRRSRRHRGRPVRLFPTRKAATTGPPPRPSHRSRDRPARTTRS